MRRVKLFLCCACLGSVLVFRAAGTLAQAPTPPQQGPALLQPQQQQGFEATGQLPVNYTPEEAAAVALVKRLIDTTNTKDLAAHMALVDDNVIHRGDPVEALGHGARGYCSAYGFIRSNAWVRLDELYAVGGPSETLVLHKRTDINNPAGLEGSLGGYPVEVAVLARVRNGKIIEWYDAPIARVGFAGVGNSRPPGGMRVPEVCAKYPVEQAGQAPVPPRGGGPPQVHAVAPPPGFGMLGYGVAKIESRFNPAEAAAAQAVRGWFAAWQAGNPLLLGAFVDQSMDFRPTPTSELIKGRDALLRSVCGTMGGQLNLTGLHVIGDYFQTMVIARWDKIDAAGTRTRMGSFFRVRNGLIVEWMDTPLAGAAPVTANPNSAACQTVNTTLAALPPGPSAQPPR